MMGDGWRRHKGGWGRTVVRGMGRIDGLSRCRMDDGLLMPLLDNIAGFRAGSLDFEFAWSLRVNGK